MKTKFKIYTSQDVRETKTWQTEQPLFWDEIWQRTTENKGYIKTMATKEITQRKPKLTQKKKMNRTLQIKQDHDWNKTQTQNRHYNMQIG